MFIRIRLSVCVSDCYFTGLVKKNSLTEMYLSVKVFLTGLCRSQCVCGHCCLILSVFLMGLCVKTGFQTLAVVVRTD